MQHEERRAELEEEYLSVRTTFLADPSMIVLHDDEKINVCEYI